MSDFVPANRLRGIKKSVIRQVFDQALPGSINLGLGEPDLPTPGIIRDAAINAIQDGHNGYTSHAGIPELREWIARDNSSICSSAKDVVVTAGSQEALYLTLMTLVDEGDEVLIPNPGFVAYPTITEMAGGTVVTYRMPASDAFKFDVEEFERSLSSRTRVVVCISPSNPTGVILAKSDLMAMAQALEGTGVYVISDEIYRDLYLGRERPGSISDYYPRTIVISGLSKSMSMTGWRLGWMCGDADVIASALVLHGYVTTCASAISQKAALATWTEAGETVRKDHRGIFAKRRDFLIRALETDAGLNAVVPGGAFYCMVDIAKYGKSVDVARACLENHVVTVPGIAFGSESEGYLRVSFCAGEETLSEGVLRIKSAINSLGKRKSV